MTERSISAIGQYQLACEAIAKPDSEFNPATFLLFIAATPERLNQVFEAGFKKVESSPEKDISVLQVDISSLLPAIKKINSYLPNIKLETLDDIPGNYDSTTIEDVIKRYTDSLKEYARTNPDLLPVGILEGIPELNNTYNHQRKTYAQWIQQIDQFLTNDNNRISLDVNIGDSIAPQQKIAFLFSRLAAIAQEPDRTDTLKAISLSLNSDDKKTIASLKEKWPQLKKAIDIENINWQFNHTAPIFANYLSMDKFFKRDIKTGQLLYDQISETFTDSDSDAQHVLVEAITFANKKLSDEHHELTSAKLKPRVKISSQATFKRVKSILGGIIAGPKEISMEKVKILVKMAIALGSNDTFENLDRKLITPLMAALLDHCEGNNQTVFQFLQTEDGLKYFSWWTENIFS